MTRVPLNLLEAFAVFADAKNMREAADQLHISQPALSHQLRLLQDYFPNDLLVVAGKKKVLTSYGKDVLLSFKGQLASVHKAIEDVNTKYKSPEEITVRIAARLEILRRLVSEVSFKGRIHYISKDGLAAIQDLLDRKIDIAISRDRPDSLNIVSKPFLNDQFCLVLPKKWKVSYKNLEELFTKLQDYPFIGYKESVSTRFSFIKQPAHRAIEDWNQVIQLVERGSGWSVVPNSFPINEKSCEIVKIKEQGYQESQFYICYHKDNLKFDWFKDLVSQASSCFNKT